MKKYEDFDEVKLVKGNIPIDKSLFNKYKNVEEIFSSCKKNYNYSKYDSGIVLPDNIPDIDNIQNMSKTEIQNLAVLIFNKYHNAKVFSNEGNEIVVSNMDIKESIYKINNFANQRVYLHEHMIIYANLGILIKKATIINQAKENKNRESNNYWNYYLISLKIKNEKYILLFDVISKTNGENHLRIQRLEIIE